MTNISNRPADLAIDGKHLGVHFNLRFNRRNTLRRTLFSMLKRDSSEGGHFWAVRDVSLGVKRGEIFGVIGANGSGKSTLLLVLAGILKPDVGTLRVGGSVSTLLTIGAGFDQDLTGRDNIYLNGAFLGLTKRQIDARIDEIIEFSELGEFIDVAIRRYSSGMRARLGFAIATTIEPDILLLDEVLGVGDAAFRDKSKERLRELVERSQAIVVVAHDMGFVNEMCSRAMWLRDGMVAAIGEPSEVTAAYGQWVRESSSRQSRSVRVLES